MTMYNFGKNLESDKKEYGVGGGSGYFTFKEGDNKVRILSAGVPVQTHFMGKSVKPAVCYGEKKGCPFHTGDENTSLKYFIWVIDKADNKIKLAKFPYTVIQQIAQLQNDSEYAFEELPVPYDMNITATNAGTKEVKYTVIPARNNTPIDPSLLQEFGKKTSIEEVVKKSKEKSYEQNPPVEYSQPAKDVENEYPEGIMY